MSNMHDNEIEIKLPWATIKALTFGLRTENRTLYLYEKKIEVPRNNRAFIVAIDFVTVQMAWPKFSNPFALDYLLAIRCIFDELRKLFQTERWTLIAQGFFGDLAILFAQIYSTYLTRVIVINSVYLHFEDPRHVAEKLRCLYECNLNGDDISKKPLILPMLTMNYLREMYTYQHVPYEIPVHVVCNENKVFTKHENEVMKMLEQYENIHFVNVTNCQELERCVYKLLFEINSKAKL